jgi:glycosyltransferase involved in cell wall biosynthesis
MGIESKDSGYGGNRRARAYLQYCYHLSAQSKERNKLRILLIGMWLPPEGSGARSWNIAKSLTHLGHSVTALTNLTTSSWKIESENRENIRVLRLPSLRIPYRGVLQRFLIFASFGIACLAAIPLIFTFDVTYCRPPHPFTDLAPLVARLFRRNRVVLDVTDLWPDALETLEGPSRLKKIFTWVGHSAMKTDYRTANVLVTNTPELRKILSQRSNKEFFLLRGLVDAEKFSPLSKEASVTHFGRFPRIAEVANSRVILYAGMMGPAQNLQMILRAAQLLPGLDGLLFLIVGEGEQKQMLANLVREKQISNVIIWDSISSELMPYLINLADACLIPLKRDNSGILEIVLPKKLCEYAACGKPVICLGSYSEASRLTIKHEAGISIESEDEQIIAKSITTLMNDKGTLERMSHQARIMAENEFSYKNNEHILTAIVSAAID